MMEEQLSGFPAQFSFVPEIERAEALPKCTRYLVCGMGGSHLGARLLLRHDRTIPLVIHSDYGLPPPARYSLSDTLIIASSYSGNTEETLDATRAALEAHLPVAVITSGGELLELARREGLPTIVMPKENIEPRVALGYSMLALASLMKKGALVEKIREAGESLSLDELKDKGARLGESLVGRFPIFYASTQNRPLAYHLKVDMNETAKIPAFVSPIPEACHNELSGFDVGDVLQERTALFAPVFLFDDEDDARVRRRMELMRDMLAEKGFSSISFPLIGESGLEKALSTALTGSYAGAYLARTYGVEDAHTPLIALFKERVKNL